MKKDTIQEFVSLRAALMKERAQLEGRLAEIDKVLGATAAGAPAAPAAPRRGPGRRKAVTEAAPEAKAPAKAPAKVAKGRRGRPKGVKRIANTMSLKEAVTQVVKGKSLTAQEIIKAVGEIGYKFAAKNPVNSLRTLLYTDKGFKNAGGKFTLA